MSVTHYTITDKFNWSSNERQQQVVLFTPAGTVSELWPEGEANYDPTSLPSEVLDMIEKRSNRYLFSSGKEAFQSKVKLIRERINEFDISWCMDGAAIYEKKAAALRATAESLKVQA